MPKRILEGVSQEERVQQRKQLGPLRNLTVQPSTRARYEAALQKFFNYLSDHQLVLPRDRRHMDPIASDYMEHLWATGAGRALAADSLAALQDYQPQLKGNLQGAWRLLRAWNATEMPSRAPPFSQEVLEAMVGLALFKGQALFALSLLIGFYGLLRTGELLAVTKAAVSVSANSSSVLISLGYTKGGKRHGAAESVKITVQDVIRRTKQWISDPSSPSSLTPPAHIWRKQFADMIDALGFSDVLYRPYSLRRGGATFYFRQWGSLDRLLILGRWHAVKSARLYIDEGMALLASLSLKWTPFSKNLRAQYLQSCNRTLPKLEPMPKGRAGPGGKRKRSTNKKRPKKSKAGRK